MVLIGRTAKELHIMYDKFIEKSNKVGLESNLGKTKKMTNSKNQRELKTVDEDIAQVKVYKYLGRIMSFKEGMNKEIKARRELAWKSYWALKNMYKRKKISIKSKVKICIRNLYLTSTDLRSPNMGPIKSTLK